MNGAKRQPPSGARSAKPDPATKRAEHEAQRALIDRCLAGASDAWESLYREFHRPLLATINGMLRNRSYDASLVDELAARVWYAVVRNGGELLGRFDPTLGCGLTTYLSMIAKDEASRLFRSERRRRRREAASLRAGQTSPAAHQQAVVPSMADFPARLTAAEREFYETVLVDDRKSAPGPNGQPYTDSNRWQLTHRIRRKLQRFLGE
jgi:DNA-directed RNA polymerase specialized sigma24 family protein